MKHYVTLKVKCYLTAVLR